MMRVYLPVLKQGEYHVLAYPRLFQALQPDSDYKDFQTHLKMISYWLAYRHGKHPSLPK